MATKGKDKKASVPEWDVTEMWANLKLPELDVAGVITAQQKNIEAINMANKTVVEGWRAITKTQTALWQSTVQESGSVAKDVAAAKKPGDKLAMQAAFATSSIEAGISNARNAQELAAKAANKTVDIVSKRFIESIEEAVDMVN